MNSKGLVNLEVPKFMIFHHVVLVGSSPLLFNLPCELTYPVSTLVILKIYMINQKGLGKPKIAHKRIEEAKNSKFNLNE